MRKGLACLLLAGCGDPLSNDIFGLDAVFRDAVPHAADVETAAPRAGGIGARDLGDAAVTPRVTQEISSLVNGVVSGLLSAVDAVADLPVSRREETLREWGPYGIDRERGSARVRVTRGDAGFSYVVELASVPPGLAGEDASWVALMEGQSDPYDDGLSGEFTFYGDALPLLDRDRFRADEERGTYDVLHLQVGGLTDLTIAFAGWESDGEDVSGTYAYRGEADGSGRFEFVVEGALDEDTEIDRWVAAVRWNQHGDGRSDLRVAGPATADAPATECWDLLLRRTYFDAEVLEAHEGDEADCTMAWEEPPPLP